MLLLILAFLRHINLAVLVIIEVPSDDSLLRLGGGETLEEDFLNIVFRMTGEQFVEGYVEEELLRLGQGLPTVLQVGEVKDLKEVKGQVPSAEEHPKELRQIGYLPEVIVLERFQVVPECILKGVLETLRVVFAESGGKQPIKLVVHLLFVHAAVDKNLDDFAFLLLFQAETGDILEGLHIVLCTNYGLKYGFLNVCVHVLLLGDIKDFILSLFLIPLIKRF